MVGDGWPGAPTVTLEGFNTIDGFLLQGGTTAIEIDVVDELTVVGAPSVIVWTRSPASANAAFIMMYGVGSLLGPPIAGMAMDSWDPQGLAVALAVFCGGYVLVALALKMKQ